MPTQIKGVIIMQTHENKVAVVTGAARGLGQSFCITLAKQGASIVGIDFSNPLDETVSAVKAAGGKILPLMGDATNPTDVSRFAKEALDVFGHVDILINNAGIYPFCPFEDMTYDVFSKVRNTNMDSVFYMTKAFIGGMKKNGWGRIVNIVSNSVAVAITLGHSHYMASKMGIMGFSRGLANEYGGFGITVNCLGPNATPTPGMKEMEKNMPGVFEFVAQMGAIKRVTKPEDYDGMLLLLTSDAGSFITGQTYYIDGGITRYE
jgi:NAD(P)-dependent dehydrogenase (short-subunit alcohol dehydrogenase family)